MLEYYLNHPNITKPTGSTRQRGLLVHGGRSVVLVHGWVGGGVTLSYFDRGALRKGNVAHECKSFENWDEEYLNHEKNGVTKISKVIYNRA